MALGASAITWLIAAGMSLLLAVWLARVGWKVLAVRHLVVFLVTAALFNVANGITLAAGTVAIPWQVLAIATILTPAAALSFYGAYKAGDDGRPWTMKLWPAAVGLVVLTMAFPALWARPGPDGIVYGPVFTLYGLNYLLFAALAFELTRDAIKEEQDASKRRSMLWLALGFSFLPAYVATSELFFIDVLGLVDVEGVFFSIAHFVSLVGGAVLLAMFFLLVRAAIRTEADQQKVDVAWFLLVLIGPGVSVLLQMLFVAFNAFDAQMSVAVEGVWAMLLPVFAAFAVARYQSFGMTTDSRPGLRIILFALLFPLAFGLGWMAGQNSFQGTPEWIVGLIFVGLTLPFVKVLWQQAHVWASRILGMRPDPDIVPPVKKRGGDDA